VEREPSSPRRSPSANRWPVKSSMNRATAPGCAPAPRTTRLAGASPARWRRAGRSTAGASLAASGSTKLNSDGVTFRHLIAPPDDDDPRHLVPSRSWSPERNGEVRQRPSATITSWPGIGRPSRGSVRLPMVPAAEPPRGW
jgi:hypothetical protein